MPRECPPNRLGRFRTGVVRDLRINTTPSAGGEMVTRAHTDLSPKGLYRNPRIHRKTHTLHAQQLLAWRTRSFSNNDVVVSNSHQMTVGIFFFSGVHARPVDGTKSVLRVRTVRFAANCDSRVHNARPREGNLGGGHLPPLA